MTTRVVLADDSLLARQLLTDMLQARDDIRVVGAACDGRQAVELAQALKPDLVIMDLLMPVLDGLDAIEEIMALCPTPVLVLSAAVEASEVDRAFMAIKRGALDVMEKPALDGIGSLEGFAATLREKVQFLSRIRVIRHPRRKLRAGEALAPLPGGSGHNILAIGASTGGPKAVMRLLKSLPADFPGAVFVVQHIAQGFAAGFASWLDRECALPVKLARDGAPFRAGEALIAPDGTHLTLAEGTIRFNDAPPMNCCRPSIDVFFDSLARQRCDNVVAVLLTGMGRDGAQGMLHIREAGGTTIVQDEPSCAVFGMPKAAITLDAADQVVPLDLIPAALNKLFAAQRPEPEPGALAPHD
ncbi:chemotaxis-specific protein-glutamate methyltransferase CheB [Geomonas subterranea]|uniref:Protein-glutamate methylesterase/protein-glutamine glutaminase n=1 Tax=Geomonas subterranea TaxID=2847989 RepID=A0ABX8LNF0_9BACT|nr:MULTISPECIES: chemotaxis-specific protein-glutamate methyltransferase CheB [Geomonas]QXE91778.1 chemotaxis-specific protein-glutamate methyltransferase CheB [Geomonas subterranea]QXM10129.1 chemotaxis-specific protein-glutamate methyltransferase CheB [Geomonas subterranea]